MSSNFKRSLYEPAAQENVGTKPKRKTLTQGRLVTQPGERNTSSAQHTSAGRRIGNSGVAAGAKSKLSSRSNVQPTTSNQDAHFSSAAVKGQSRGHGMREDPTSPRREYPSVTEHDSPRQVKPSHSLDLSQCSDNDSVSEVIFSPQRGPLRHIRHTYQPEVVVVDASGGKTDLNKSEVEVDISVETSPAKIYCHSKAVLQSGLSKDTGDPELARKITTDAMPRVNISGNHTSSLDKHNYELDPGHHVFKSPLVVKESGIAGGEIDLHSSAKPALVLEEPTEPLEESELRMEQGRRGIGGLHSFASNSSLDSLECTQFSADGDLGASHTEPNIKKALNFEDDKDKTKKKKKVRVIQSRFMQAAAAKSKGPMKATDRSVMQTSQKLSRSTSFSGMSKSSSNPKMKSFQGTPPVRSGSTGKSPLTSKKTGPVQSSSNKVNISQMSTTPEAKGQSHKASTPSTEDDKSFFADVSAIAPVDKRKKPSGDSSSASLLATSSSGAHESHESQPKSAKKKAKPIVSQRRLDIEYVRYIQWLYLDAKIHKVFEEQEKEAMGQMYALHEENQKLEQRQEDLELILAQAQYVNALDDALDAQQSGLHAVSQSLPKLDSEHQTLAQALDTTRHQIATRGIHIPEDEDEYYRNLEVTMRETEQLLGELSVMCREKQPKITNFASVVQTLQKDVDLETDELARCKELVAACQTLATEEGSLVVQDLQREAQCILQH